MHHFVSLDHDHATQFLSVFTSKTSFFFSFVASKNAWRGTLDSTTQTKERKWVSFELSKFILGSGAEGNKTGTWKVYETFDFTEIESVMILCFFLKASKKTVVSIGTRQNLLLGDHFWEKVGGRVLNKKERRTACS